jgi:hypothetical protein
LILAAAQVTLLGLIAVFDNGRGVGCVVEVMGGKAARLRAMAVAVAVAVAIHQSIKNHSDNDGHDNNGNDSN